jgi:hypothetical protein
MVKLEEIMCKFYEMFKSEHMKRTKLADTSYTLVDDLKLKSVIEIKESV